MIRRLPILPTVVVLIAVAIMVRLGFWQLDRMAQKEELLSQYARVGQSDDMVPWPRSAAETERNLFRQARVNCLSVFSIDAKAGHNAAQETGYAQVANCQLAEGGSAPVVIGWSKEPRASSWQGGVVSGWIAPGPRLVASTPLAGLIANAKPDPKDLPNNHLSYAVQWFLFAATALVIYVLALRKHIRS